MNLTTRVANLEKLRPPPPPPDPEEQHRWKRFKRIYSIRPVDRRLAGDKNPNRSVGVSRCKWANGVYGT